MTLFKPLLFPCVGIVIHSMKNNQDTRYRGGHSFRSINVDISKTMIIGTQRNVTFHSLVIFRDTHAVTTK